MSSDPVPQSTCCSGGERNGEGASSRREFLGAAAAACCATAALAAGPAVAAAADRVVIANVDRFRVREPQYEGVRIVLSYLGEKYTPAYIQGISGGAFRVAGICPCAPNCSVQMGTTDLVKLLGYAYAEGFLGWTGDVEDAKRNMVTVIPRIKEAVRNRRPVLLWYGFADSAYEVVTGYDDTAGTFLGWHLHQGPSDAMAEAKQNRAEEAARSFPAFGALFIGEKTGVFDARAAEVAALREAARHARDGAVSKQGPPRQGLACYTYWVDTFRDPHAKRGPGDSHCQQVYRSTHRCAGAFLKEIAPKYPGAAAQLQRAAREFVAEANALDRATPLIGWQSPEHDADRNAKLWPLLAKARDHYAAGIEAIECALPLLG